MAASQKQEIGTELWNSPGVNYHFVSPILVQFFLQCDCGRCISCYQIWKEWKRRPACWYPILLLYTHFRQQQDKTKGTNKQPWPGEHSNSSWLQSQVYAHISFYSTHIYKQLEHNRLQRYSVSWLTIYTEIYQIQRVIKGRCYTQIFLHPFFCISTPCSSLQHSMFEVQTPSPNYRSLQCNIGHDA